MPDTRSAPSRVDAYRTTGTSPGAATRVPPRLGRFTATLELDHQAARDLAVGFEVHGDPDAPAVVVLGGISASAHLAAHAGDTSPGWWPAVVGRGGALDPARHRLVGLDYLGGAESAWRPAAPLTTADQARAALALLDYLGIACATVVGASYGGMVGMALAELAPRRVSGLIAVCATHRPHPLATAQRSVQRAIVRLAAECERPRDGVALARALAMTTYRSAVELEGRFAHRPERTEPVVRFPVDAYVSARGEAFADRFDASAYIRLSESVDLHHVDPARLRVALAVVAVDTDQLAPPWLVEELVRGAPNVVRREVVRSPYGHDAFLKAGEDIGRAVSASLRAVGVAS